jgi:hypothetical protein
VYRLDQHCLLDEYEQVVLDFDLASPAVVQEYLALPVSDQLHPARVLQGAQPDVRNQFREICDRAGALVEWCNLAMRFSVFTTAQPFHVRFLPIIASKQASFLDCRLIHRSAVTLYMGHDTVESADEFELRTGVSLLDVVKTTRDSIARVAEEILQFARAAIVDRELTLTDGNAVMTQVVPTLEGQPLSLVRLPAGFSLLSAS